MEAAPNASFLSQIHKGLPFSITLLMILLFHEFGHYFMAKKHHVDATLPYFIPAPSIIGTFGAVIKMRSPLRSKRALLDIGGRRPFSRHHYRHSCDDYWFYIFPKSNSSRELTAAFHSDRHCYFRCWPDSLLARFLRITIFFCIRSPLPDGLVCLSPCSIFYQSDNWMGGHIAYAVLGKRLHQLAAYILLPLLFVLGLIAWQGWLIWCALLFFVMGTKHPPTMDEYSSLDRKRKIIGWIALVIFVLTFTPSPFHISL